MKTKGKIRGKHSEYIVWNRPKKSYLILQDIRRLMLEYSELQDTDESSTVRNMCCDIIEKLKTILHKDY